MSTNPRPRLRAALSLLAVGAGDVPGRRLQHALGDGWAGKDGGHGVAQAGCSGTGEGDAGSRVAEGGLLSCAPSPYVRLFPGLDPDHVARSAGGGFAAATA